MPLWPIAVQWLIFYWPLLTSTEFVAQKHGEHPSKTNFIAFRTTVAELRADHGPTGLYDLLAQLDADPQRFRPRLKIIAARHPQRAGDLRGWRGDADFSAREARASPVARRGGTRLGRDA